jgi:hypothetical protein
MPLNSVFVEIQILRRVCSAHTVSGIVLGSKAKTSWWSSSKSALSCLFSLEICMTLSGCVWRPRKGNANQGELKMFTTKDMTKQIPDFAIFKDEDGKLKQLGVGFKHRTGDGFNLLIGAERYAVFPTKTKIKAPEAAE